MADKIHGHAPRVRHRQNDQSEETVVEVNTEKVLNTVVSSAIGAIIGTAVTSAINEG